MVCRWLQVCLAAAGGAPGDMGGGVSGEVGVSGGLKGKKLMIKMEGLFNFTLMLNPLASEMTIINILYSTIRH